MTFIEFMRIFAHFPGQHVESLATEEFARQWFDLGFTPEMSGRWTHQGFTPTEAIREMAAGKTIASVERMGWPARKANRHQTMIWRNGQRIV